MNFNKFFIVNMLLLSFFIKNSFGMNGSPNSDNFNKVQIGLAPSAIETIETKAKAFLGRHALIGNVLSLAITTFILTCKPVQKGLCKYPWVTWLGTICYQQTLERVFKDTKKDKAEIWKGFNPVVAKLLDEYAQHAHKKRIFLHPTNEVFPVMYIFLSTIKIANKILNHISSFSHHRGFKATLLTKLNSSSTLPDFLKTLYDDFNVNLFEKLLLHNASLVSLALSYQLCIKQ